MIHVCIFIGSLTAGGAERVAVSLSRYLVDQGVKVTLVTMHDRSRDFFFLDTRVQRICLGLAGGSAYRKKIQATVRRLVALRRVFKMIGPDVVIGMMTSASLFSIAASVGLKTKAIATERNYPGSKSIPIVWSVLRIMCYRFADAHVAQTNDGAEWITKYASAKRIHVISNAVSWPLPHFEPMVAPESIISGEKKVVLAVGGKVDQKGIDLLVKSFVESEAYNFEWQLVVLGLDSNDHGHGDQSKVLRDRVGALIDSDSIHFPGRVGNMTDWYERADVFILSSRYEGFPNALLEAMAGGCAVIAFDCKTGPRDIVTDGVDGILVSPEHQSEMTAALDKVVSDTDLRTKLGNAAKNVRVKYSEERVFRSWLSTIESVIAGG